MRSQLIRLKSLTKLARSVGEGKTQRSAILSESWNVSVCVTKPSALLPKSTVFADDRFDPRRLCIRMSHSAYPEFDSGPMLGQKTVTFTDFLVSTNMKAKSFLRLLL